MFDFLDKMKYELKSLFERIITNTRRFFCKHYYVKIHGRWLFCYVECKKCGRVKKRKTIHDDSRKVKKAERTLDPLVINFTTLL